VRVRPTGPTLTALLPPPADVLVAGPDGPAPMVIDRVSGVPPRLLVGFA